MGALFHLRDVIFRYEDGRRPALDGLTLGLYEGEFHDSYIYSMLRFEFD